MIVEFMPNNWQSFRYPTGYQEISAQYLLKEYPIHQVRAGYSVATRDGGDFKIRPGDIVYVYPTERFTMDLSSFSMPITPIQQRVSSSVPSFTTQSKISTVINNLKNENVSGLISALQLLSGDDNIKATNLILAEIWRNLLPDNVYTVVNVNLNTIYTNAKVFEAGGMIKPHSLSIPPQDIDYQIELRAGNVITVLAGNGLSLSNLIFDNIKLTTTSTVNATMQIFITGRR